MLGLLGRGVKLATGPASFVLKHALHSKVLGGVGRLLKMRPQGASGRPIGAAQQAKSAARRAYQTAYGQPPAARMTTAQINTAVRGANVATLRKTAMAQGVKGVGRMSKAQLVSALRRDDIVTRAGRGAIAAAAHPLTSRLVASTAIIQTVAAGRHSEDKSLSDSWRDASDTAKVMAGIGAASVLLRAGGLAVAPGLALASAVAYGVHRGMRDDKDNPGRGAGRGLVRAIDPTQVIDPFDDLLGRRTEAADREKGRLQMVFDRRFGVPQGPPPPKTMVEQGQDAIRGLQDRLPSMPALPSLPQMTPRPGPHVRDPAAQQTPRWNRQIDNNAPRAPRPQASAPGATRVTYLNADARSGAHAGTPVASGVTPRRAAPGPDRDGLTRSYVRVQAGKTVTVSGYATPKVA